MKSPSFSQFRELMDLWDSCLRKNAISDLLDNEGLCFFFTKGGDIFGAPEEGRLMFAKMKCPDEEDTDGLEELTFAAINLKNALSGEKKTRIFSLNDLSDLEIIDQDKLEKFL